MKILIAPNYFKGSISALRAAEIIENAIISVNSNVETIKCPVADGGDGTIDSISYARGGILVSTAVRDPLYRKIKADWLRIDNSTAIIESAKANGLNLLNPDEYNPFKTISAGVGDLINDALDHNCSKIIIGVGGSATNDAGFGALKALGVKFLDIYGNEINNDINAFKELDKIDISNFNPKLINSKIHIATDVLNPLTGNNGASFVYAQQKGAKISELSRLDDLLSIFADICAKTFNADKRNLPGSGAAGGLAYGLAEFIGAKICNGFDLISDLIDLENKVKNADIIITGEGKLDSQTLWGKAPFKVAQIANKYNKPCFAVAGIVEDNIEISPVFKNTFSLVNSRISVQESINNPHKYLNLTIRENLEKILS